MRSGNVRWGWGGCRCENAWEEWSMKVHGQDNEVEV